MTEMRLTDVALPPQSLHVPFKGGQQDVHDLVALQGSAHVLDFSEEKRGAEKKNQPLTQSSTAGRPESAGKASGCRKCAAGTLISAPANARMLIKNVCWSWATSVQGRLTHSGR